MEYQQTLAKPVKLTGIGIHSGESVTATFLPAPAGHGIVFVRTDLPGQPRVPATIDHLADLAAAPRRTSIALGEASIQTVEHVMAALWGLGIDNAVIELTGSEPPGLDGSALPIVEALQAAGCRTQEAPRRYFDPQEPVYVEDGGASVALTPSSELRISYTLSYDHPWLREQVFNTAVTQQLFAEHIAPARTFCLEREAQELRRQGLGKGANFDNTLVVGNGGVIGNRLRFEDEFVRHKVLDLIGDLYLLGVRLRGHVVATKSGHALNMRLLSQLAAQWARADASGRAAGTTTKEVTSGTVLDINEIRNILPHRYPFLLVDKITALEADKRIVGIKNVTANEEFFQGHFPDRPIMPGVLIIEAMAQVGGILILHKRGRHGQYAYLMSVDQAKFRKAVVPGDQLAIQVEIVKLKSRTGVVRAEARVDGKVAAEAELTFALVE